MRRPVTLGFMTFQVSRAAPSWKMSIGMAQVVLIDVVISDMANILNKTESSNVGSISLKLWQFLILNIARNLSTLISCHG